MPKWDPNILGEELLSFIKLLVDKEQKQKQKEIGQLSSFSRLIMQILKWFF